MKFKFRNASISEISTAFDLLKETAEWLKEKSIDYWQDWHNPPENFKEWIRERFRNKEFYFVEENNKVIAMYRLQFNDELFWGKKNDKSGYIHSFTTRRNLVGKGIGFYILKEIEKELKTNKYDFLRLDCGSHITGLCKYYENYGFKNVGETTVYGERLTLLKKSCKVFQCSFFCIITVLL